MMSLAGWTWKINIDEKYLKKSIIVCAPHTSNWDFYYAVFGFWAIGVPIKVFIKDSHTKAFYGKIIEWIGGIGINRAQASDMVSYAADLLKNNDDFVFLITPEGTRSFSERWKKGFYYIAQKANVPILIGIGDYKNKMARIESAISVENKSYEEVCKEIEPFYKAEYAKHPEKYNPKIY